MESSLGKPVWSSLDVAVNDDPQPEQEIITTRAYQLELFGKSMKSNLIVTMDTGSGKTWIAKLRIEAELARRPAKIVWFTAPSVVLAEQQHKYLSHHLASYSTRLITGSDNTHLWSTQEVWDAILNVNLIVSTPQILLEGLERGFLHLQRISLLVIDEAHHCIAKHPSNIIMQLFYHPSRRTNIAPELPCILGMTASPIITKLADMEILESNLHATCKSPTQHIEEYRDFVHIPEIVSLTYSSRELRQSLPIELMLRVLTSVDISEDPWVKQLLKENTLEALQKHDRVLETRSTSSMDQLKKLQGNTQHVYSQLGAWSTHIWLREILLKLHSKVESRDWLSSISDEEHCYLDGVLSEIRDLTSKAAEEGDIMDQISSKAECLIHFLAKEYAKDVLTSCAIFVERRSTAFALSKLLQNHPSIPCTVASFVGSSRSGKKTNLIDLADLATQKTELDEFRSGVRSILVATSVMEEGIDVQATNLVVRFDDAMTVKSFTQSRGRARKAASKFVVMHNSDDLTSKKYTDWMTLEAEMKARYMDEMRQIQTRLKLEEEEEEEGWVYSVSSTGAKLTFDNARSLLEHFCQSLKKLQYEPNPRPTFICQGAPPSYMSAKVILPSSLPTELKEVCGSGIWRTEKAAKRDAAFGAMRKLHRYGLLNDHLLPPPMRKPDSIAAETRAEFIDIRPQMNPWRLIPTTEDDADMLLHVYRLTFENAPKMLSEEKLSALLLLLPTKLESSISVPLHYTHSQTVTARIVYVGPKMTSFGTRLLAKDVTLYLLGTALASKKKDLENWASGLPFYSLPDVAEADLRGWLNFSRRSQPLVRCFEPPLSARKGIVALRHTPSQRLYLSDLERSDLTNRNTPFAQPEHIPAVLAKRISKRIDYITHNNAPPSITGQPIALAIEDCVIEQITASMADTMQFIPSILRMIEFALVATACCTDLLHILGASNKELVVEALTSPLACSEVNYERLEFFGDTMLKLYACLQVYAKPENAHFPEGYLTLEAMNLINNARLQRAAIEMGLDRFMIHEPFVPKKWKPQISTPQEDDERSYRATSTKIVADHVEALIAVAYLDEDRIAGKDTKAIALLNALIPDVKWTLPETNVAALPDLQSADSPSLEALSIVETIIDYKFKRRCLLAEALNHSSTSITLPTYGRLEFLGDAVLQRIVNEAVYKAAPHYSQNQMHLRQIACVSHSYLAYLCFEANCDIQRVNVSTDLVKQEATLEETTETKYLWQYMIHSSMEIAPVQQRCLKRYLEYRQQVREELAHSKTYPWALLASIAAPKFFSDIIESVLAAVFIDSGADLHVCSRVLEKLGMKYLLQRLIDEPDMILAQPKTILWEKRAQAGLPALKAVSQSRREVDGQRYNCQLMLEGEVVYAEVIDAWSDEEAVLRASDIGLKKFREEQKASKMPDVEDGVSQRSLDDQIETGKQKRKRES